jgi:hypothetical protein
VRAKVASCVLALACVAPGRALAEETKAACARSAEAGQRLRDEGKPLAAHTQLLACSRPACPMVIRGRCARWLEQVDATIPTVVIKARAGSASHPFDVTDVAVSVDGVRVQDTLDGQPLRVEPGEHTLTYMRGGAAPIEARVLLAAGEKNRILVVDFLSSDPEPSVAASAAGPPRDRAPAPAEGRTSIRPAAWVFAGLAVVGGGLFGYFGATGKSDLDSLRSSCAGHCAEADVSAAWNKLVVADVSLAAGVVCAGIATWLFLTPRHEPAPRDAAASGLVLGPRDHGFQLGWQGAF